MPFPASADYVTNYSEAPEPIPKQCRLVCELLDWIKFTTSETFEIAPSVRIKICQGREPVF